ncbi:rhodanese-like domain-containing protein [Methylomonas sp. BW4-1]|uniref:Rhodanese-like domain-containing protein n=1 Tax=Methylomonas defluvii TaxID=3045149 RepID=A0ABU4ULQ6_9GAMM|nr:MULTISPECIES: rhodanese-like domain-containing protein [unclassified Methylomonas]MDX8129730.1 rhodanese-like domain-containing protein [Methylomonas sp. OY6]NOV29664.1 rhodanese [Methylomonas sp. ZR1]PKD40828.1 rhodanese [Methylomonas sp. Kb3]QBC27440.1 rhodanese [Methylomonas sp. LW13]QSA99475.1 rhodanese [Methylomonas sp. EFPC1]
MPINQYTPEQLKQHLQDDPSVFLLDVREPHEFAYAKIAGSVLIPLQQIPARFDEVPADRDVVVICHHGMRSQQACHFLQHSGLQRLFNLKGGIDAWSVICDPSVPRY